MLPSIHRAALLLAVAAGLGGSAIALAAAGGGQKPQKPEAPAEAQPPVNENKTASAKPCPCPETPVQAAAKPDPGLPEPNAAQVKPNAAEPKPNAAQVKPNAAEPKPKKAEPKPKKAEPKPSKAELLRGFDPLSHQRVNGHLVSELKDQWRAVLSLHPGLQAHVKKIFERYRVPFGAMVAVQPSTGRVLAYVSHSSADQNAGDLARDPTPPSASVFKVITAAALLDAGVKPERRVCYGGGMRRLVMADLEDNPQRDRHCLTLQDAMGYSANAVFAKLADRHLDRRTLQRYASAFGFGHSLPFDTPTHPSPMQVPEDRVEFARTAAGFWHMYMSPLHGALIAATVANNGVMPRASVIDSIVDEAGEVLYSHQPKDFRPVIPRSTAGVLGRMMTRTITHGTARRAFYDPRGRAFLPGISVAGKTGSLTQQQPYRAYSWWIGFAPMDSPRIAVAALVVNEPRWRIKSSYLARETLRYYLIEDK